MTKTLDADPGIPLVVDLDRALALSDPAWERFTRLLFGRPAAMFAALPRRAGGTAVAEPAERRPLDPVHPPLRAELVALLRAENARGRALHLIGADQRSAEAVAGELAIFTSAAGDDAAAEPNRLE